MASALAHGAAASIESIHAVARTADLLYNGSMDDHDDDSQSPQARSQDEGRDSPANKPARRWNMRAADAIRLMNPAALAQALEAEDPDAIIARGQTALTLAAEFPDDDIDLASAILDAGARIDQVDSRGQTPLLASVGHRNARMARELLRRGARTGIQDSEGRTALMLCCASALTEMARDLLAKRADPNIRAFDGKTALMVCASLRVWHGRSRLLLPDLLQAGADIDAVDDEGKTALIHAIEAGHSKAAILLCDSGASLAPPGSRGDAIQAARSLGNHEVAHALAHKASSQERSEMERSAASSTAQSPPAKRL